MCSWVQFMQTKRKCHVMCFTRWTFRDGNYMIIETTCNLLLVSLAVSYFFLLFLTRSNFLTTKLTFCCICMDVWVCFLFGKVSFMIFARLFILFVINCVSNVCLQPYYVKFLTLYLMLFRVIGYLGEKMHQQIGRFKPDFAYIPMWIGPRGKSEMLFFLFLFGNFIEIKQLP